MSPSYLARFEGTLLLNTGLPIYSLRFLPPGLHSRRDPSSLIPTRQALGDGIVASARGVQPPKNAMQSLHLDGIAVSLFHDLNHPNVYGLDASIFWLRNLTIAFRTLAWSDGDETLEERERNHESSLNSELTLFLENVPNLVSLDIGLVPEEVHNVDLRLSIHMPHWQHLTKLIFRGCSEYSETLLAFLAKHRESLEEVTFDHIRIQGGDTWEVFLEHVCHIKVWKSFNLCGQLKDRDTIYWLGRCGNEDHLQQTDIEARQQIQKFTARQITLNPFDVGGAAVACRGIVEDGFYD